MHERRVRGARARPDLCRIRRAARAARRRRARARRARVPRRERDRAAQAGGRAAREAATSPSVNTLVFRDGGVDASSTDAAILDGLAAARPRVVGAGGAAMAFREVLPARARPSRAAPNGRRTSTTSISWFTRRPSATKCSCGSHPGRRSSTCRTLIARRPLRHVRPAPTVLDGLDVLVAQGAASFELWTGLPAPVEVMRAAVRSAA